LRRSCIRLFIFKKQSYIPLSRAASLSLILTYSLKNFSNFVVATLFVKRSPNTKKIKELKIENRVTYDY